MHKGTPRKLSQLFLFSFFLIGHAIHRGRALAGSVNQDLHEIRRKETKKGGKGNHFERIDRLETVKMR